jgi:hypothetical protein
MTQRAGQTGTSVNKHWTSRRHISDAKSSYSLSRIKYVYTDETEFFKYDILLTVYHYVSQVGPQISTSQQLQVHATHTKNC